MRCSKTASLLLSDRQRSEIGDIYIMDIEQKIT